MMRQPTFLLLHVLQAWLRLKAGPAFLLLALAVGASAEMGSLPLAAAGIAIYEVVKKAKRAGKESTSRKGDVK